MINRYVIAGVHTFSAQVSFRDFHHAVGGSAAFVSELSLVLQGWTADAIPELCT